MRNYRIPNTDLEVSQIAYGCMLIGGEWNREPISQQTRNHALRVVRAALDEGINFFDHADIYCLGKSEEVFSHLWQESPSLRQQIVIQSKCGIRFQGDPDDQAPNRYDFSYEHILRSVEGSLRRLGTDSLDLLLLHRPDPLVEPEEVSRAFDELHRAGKVRYFGVSNHTAAQIELLRRALDQPLVVNQVELNILHTHLLDEGIVFNQDVPNGPVRGDGTLEYCRLNQIFIQAWAPLAGGLLTGKPIYGAEARAAEAVRTAEAADLVEQLAKQKGLPREAIAISWLLRHPAPIQPVIGTTRPERVRAACQAEPNVLTREEWYSLFIAGRGADLP